FLDVRIGKPPITMDGSVEDTSPQTCRLSDRMYATPIMVNIEHTQGSPDNLVIGLVKQHLDSFNYFVQTGIKRIVHANGRIQATRYPHIYIRFLDVKISKPPITIDGSVEDIIPQTCRLSDRTVPAMLETTKKYEVPMVSLRDAKAIVESVIPNDNWGKVVEVCKKKDKSELGFRSSFSDHVGTGPTLLKWKHIPPAFRSVSAGPRTNTCRGW
ncbi:hypothetical protein RYX36_002638, partial [Vicia faba]